MDCAGFERELVELMDGDPAWDAQERDRRLRAMRAHAVDCDACAACEELLALLELPGGRRDPESDPGQAYWDSFDRRVRERIRREATRTRPLGRWWIAAAAAAVLVLLVGSWTFRRDVVGPQTTTAIAGPESAATPLGELPEELAKMVEAAPADVLVQLDDLAGWGSGGDAATAGGGVFPDVSGLDGDASQAFLQWLREQTS